MLKQLFKHFKYYDKRINRDHLMAVCQRLFPSPIRTFFFELRLISFYKFFLQYFFGNAVYLLQIRRNLKNNKTNISLIQIYHFYTIFSPTVSTGGKIFHCYLNLASSSTTYDWWMGRCRQRERSTNLHVPLTLDEMDRVLDAEGNFFHGFILQSIHMSGHARTQLFYPTFAATCHGLSKMGRDMFASYGFCTPHTSYHRLRDDIVARANQRIRLLLKNTKYHLIYDRKRGRSTGIPTVDF